MKNTNLMHLNCQEQPTNRNELIMIAVPKPKFIDRKVPTNQSANAYFDEICYRQTHILRDAIDRVSLNLKWLRIKNGFS